MNKNPTTAVVEVSLPNNAAFPGYPRTVSIGPNGKEEFLFSTTAPNDIRVAGTATSNTNKGIRVRVTNNVTVTVVGSNSEDKSTDAFLVLPCQQVTINEYKYFLFSSDREGSQTSQFLVVACEDATTVTYTTAGGTVQPTQTINSYSVFNVIDNLDFTGGLVTTNNPVAVFSGHQCGRIPKDKSACDHLVEQIPMHAVWGNTFFTSPFGYRGSGEIYRIGSTLDDNVITTTCTRRSGSSNPVTTTTSRTINARGYYQLETERSPIDVELTNYRREICCIETSKPAIVMQYMPGHNLDETSVASIGSGIGDPSMSIIPPVEQYRNSFISTTIRVGSAESFSNLVTWTAPVEFLSPPVRNEVFLDGKELSPAPLQAGTGDYIPITCSNMEVCGYGAISPLSSVTNGNAFRLEFNSSKNEYGGANFNLYGYVAEMSYAYPAGFEMEPIGRTCTYKVEPDIKNYLVVWKLIVLLDSHNLYFIVVVVVIVPRVAVYSVTVPESIGSVSIVFNRTGGDLSTNSRIFALNRDIPG